MNYFELYGLPITFHPDLGAVKKQFYALSKQYHPDFYINEPVEKQEEVLSLSTLNNKAYNVLKDPHKVLHYVLELHGMLPEGENYPLPQDFLMEMMDVNEELMDLQFDLNKESLVKVKKTVEEFEKSLKEALDSHSVGFETLENDHRQVKLVKIKDLYYRAKYLARLKETISKLEQNS